VTSEALGSVFELQNAPLQKAHQERFRPAIAFAEGAKVDTEYQTAAKARGQSAFNVAVADFLHPPEIQEIDLSTYQGLAGQTISITATDDVMVKTVGAAGSERCAVSGGAGGMCVVEFHFAPPPTLDPCNPIHPTLTLPLHAAPKPEAPATPIECTQLSAPSQQNDIGPDRFQSSPIQGFKRH
jgi:hypothetical protein